MKCKLFKIYMRVFLITTLAMYHQGDAIKTTSVNNSDFIMLPLD